MFYHIRITQKSNKAHDETNIDLTEEQITERFLLPYENGEPIIINGKTIHLNDLERISISRSNEPSCKLIERIRIQERENPFFVMGTSYEWQAADEAENVTDQYIKGPAGYKSKLSISKEKIPKDEKIFNNYQIDKLPLFDFIKAANITQIGIIISILIGTYFFGYYTHTWKSDKEIYDISNQNKKLELEIEKLQTVMDNVKYNSNKLIKLNYNGIWSTETPFFKDVQIRFNHTDNNVFGKYEYISKSLQKVDGMIEGELSGNVLIGKWLEKLGNISYEGLLYFTLSLDGKSFLGRYTRFREGNQKSYVWTGRKESVN